MVNLDNTLIEVPRVLRDRIAGMRLHRRQPFYEIIEDALDFWDDALVPPGRLEFEAK